MQSNKPLKIHSRASVKDARHSRSRGPVVWITLAALTVVIGVSSYKSAIDKGVIVDVTSVKQRYTHQIHTILSSNGLIIAERKSDIAPKISGRIVSILVKPGSEVKKGQVIARLDDKDEILRRDQGAANLYLAETNLKNAKTDLEKAGIGYERYSQLFARGSVSRAEYDAALDRFKRARTAADTAKASIAALNAALERSKVALDHTRVRAPFNGVVLKINASAGDIVTPSAPDDGSNSSIAIISDFDTLHVQTHIPDYNINRIKEGQPCMVIIDTVEGTRFTGEVEAITPLTEGQRSIIKVKILMPKSDPRVIPGTKAKVAFLSAAIDPDQDKLVTVVKKTALINSQDNYFVFVIDNKRAFKKKVAIGTRFEDLVEIIDGLSRGDKVVDYPAADLKDGGRVKAD